MPDRERAEASALLPWLLWLNRVAILLCVAILVAWACELAQN